MKGVLPYKRIGGLIYHDSEEIQKMMESKKQDPNFRWFNEMVNLRSKAERNCERKLIWYSCISFRCSGGLRWVRLKGILSPDIAKSWTEYTLFFYRPGYTIQ